jgi:hypothetical protein
MDQSQRANGDHMISIELTGKKLLAAEWNIDLENAIATEQLLESGNLGKRAPEIWENLGGVLALLSLAASCHWGCRGQDHDVENLIRRCGNYAFAALNLARTGFYDEAMAMIRGVAEVSNLLELFAIDNEHLRRWKTLPEKDRRREYGPVKVRLMIEDSGQEVASNEDTYDALCTLGIHVTPESMRTSHQPNGQVYVGACFSAIGLLAVLNELAINLSPVILFAGYLLRFPKERIDEFRMACDTLRNSCTTFVRASNYRDHLAEIQAAGEGKE